MIKKRVNATRSAVGVRLSDLGQSKRLWLSLILSFLCAALVCCAFVLPNLGKNEINSAKAYTTTAKSTFSKIGDGAGGYVEGYLLQGVGNYAAVTYAKIKSGTANTSIMDRSFDGGEGKCVAYMYKPKTQSAVKGYMAFKAEISVPAYTEYKVTYNFSHYYQRYRQGNTGGKTGTEFFYFGDSEHGGSDKSSTLTFQPLASSSADYSKSYMQTMEGETNKTNYVTIEITYTNNTVNPKPCTAYFGLYTHTTDCGNSTLKLGVTGKVTLISETVEATDTATPTPDKSEADYNASGNNFNFLYDKNSVDLTSVSYVDANGNTSDVTSSCALDTDGNCKLYDAGTYTFSFDIKPNLCLVWDTTGDKDTQEVSVTVKQKVLQINWSEQTYDNGETGPDSLYFMLPTLNVTQTVKNLLTDVRYYPKANYDADTGTVTGLPVELADIEENNEYYAVVELKDGLSKNNYSFSGKLYSLFDTSDSRTLIVVSVANSGETYNELQHPAVAKAVTTDGDELTVGTDINFQYTYYKDGDDVYGSGSTVAPTNAGAYKVVVAIKPSYNTEYKPYDTMEFEYVIEKADPVLDPVRSDSNELYAGGAMPEIVYNAANASATPGTYTWTAQKLISGTNNYGYTFTPGTGYAENYNTASGTLELTTEDAKITSISAEWKYTDEEGNPLDDEDGNPLTVYDSWKPDDLKQYIKVSGTMNNGNTVDNILDYKISGAFGAGDKTFTVKYGKDETVQCPFTVEGIVACELTEITAEFSPDGNIYTSTDVESYKEMLEVKAVYNDGRVVEIAGDQYELSAEKDDDGNLVKGVQDITVTYVDEDGNGNKYTTTFEVNIKEVLLASLKAYFAPGLNKIENTTPLDELKKWLTVTGVNNDDSKFEVTEYELTGKLESGKESTITVKFGGKSTTFKVNVAEAPVEVKKTLLPVPQLKEVAYTGEEIDILSGWEHVDLVEAVGNKNTVVGPYTLVLKIKDYDTYEWDTSSLTLKSEGKGLAKYALAVEYEGYNIEEDTLTAQWKITPAILTGTWNDQGTLDLLSSSYKGETSGLVNYTYYNKDGEEVDPANLIIGETYTVTAELADTSNFEFDAVLTEPHEFKKELPPAGGGIQAVWSAMNSKMAGLPLWAWIAIGLAVLILLIIIIVVAVVSKKKREEEKKEEKKLEREERMMRMQMGGGAMPQMPITAAGMIAAQQAQQMQQAQQAMQQPQVVPQPQPQQAMPAPVQAQVQQHVQQPAPAVAGNSNGVAADIAELEERLRLAEERAQIAEERIALDAEERARAAEERLLRATEQRARLAEEQLMRNAYMNRNPATGAENGNVQLGALGALVLAALKNYAGGEQPEKVAPEQQQKLEAASATIPTVYPPDAVITTTTTVDTTKKSDDKFARRPKLDESKNRSERSDSIDLDGFYDEYNG